MPSANQLPAQLGVVVRAPVEHDAGAGPFGADRLFPPSMSTDDGEPPHPDCELLPPRRPTSQARGARSRPASLEQLRVAAGETGYPAHGGSVTAYEVPEGSVVTVAPAGNWNSEGGGEGE